MIRRKKLEGYSVWSANRRYLVCREYKFSKNNACNEFTNYIS